VIAILSKSAPADEALARQMLAAAPHRGDCIALRTLGSCVIGVATKADFVDAHVSVAGPVIAALMGKLDNAADLSRELTERETAPATPADVDIVVALFRAHGVNAPRLMRGAFAGVVTDGHSLWCFRDHAGFRPLFYRDGPGAFVAAIEPRQVAVGARLAEEPDFEVLEQMLFGRMPSDAGAALKGVSRLAQASVLAVHGMRGPAITRYWNPVDLLERSPVAPGDLQERFDELMGQAVGRALTGSDAVLLSGGVDSPTVAAYAARAPWRRSDGRLGALSCVFPDLPSVDESPYIELAAQEFGIALDTYRPTARALDDVEGWCRLFASPVPIVSVPELADNHARARQLGYGNILTGDFAEFTFGSPWHLVEHLLTRGRWWALARLLRRERWRGVPWGKLVRHVVATFVPGRFANWYLHARRLDAPERIPDWLDARRVNPFRGDMLPPPRRRWQQAQLNGTEGATITIEADEVCAALAGVTVRRPFADVDLWEFFLGLPAETKCPDLRFKTLAKRLLRGRLPDEILDRRRKTYFDEHVMAQVDYPALKRLLVNPRHRVAGVDYQRLAGRIERAAITRFDWLWAKDLAWIHAFLSAW
jgi:asparagine synthase (glutamine-hydrolysing)